MKVLYLLLGSLVALPLSNQSVNDATVPASSSTTEPVTDPVPGQNLDNDPQENLENTEDNQQEEQTNEEENELDDQSQENDTDQDPVEPTNTATLSSLPTNTEATLTQTTTFVDSSQVPTTTNGPPLETLPPQNTTISSPPVTTQIAQSTPTFTTPLAISTVQPTNQVPSPTHTTTLVHQIPEFTTLNPLPRPSVQPTPDSNPEPEIEQPQESETRQFQPLIADNPLENIENQAPLPTKASTTLDTINTETIENPPTVGPNIAQDEFSSAPSFGQVYKGNSNTSTNNKKTDKSSAQQLGLGIMVIVSVLLV